MVFDWQRSLTLEIVWKGLHCFSVLHYQGQFNKGKYHKSSPLWSSEADGFVWGTDQRLDLSMAPLDVTPRFNVIGSHGCCNQRLTFESGSRWKDSLWIKSSISSHKATASEDCFHDAFISFYGHAYFYMCFHTQKCINKNWGWVNDDGIVNFWVNWIFILNKR